MGIIIDNFSIKYKEWEQLDDLSFLSVDVVDTTSGSSIVTSGTYFIQDGNTINTTFSGIANGYRCYYYNPQLVSSGVINLVVHAESTSGEIKERTYELLYGYHLLFNDVIDWGPNNKVVTTVLAKNSVICPNLVSESSYFETKDLDSIRLNASIWPIESKNLNAVIYPQNDFFFYGSTYTITISGVKDMAGNIMPPFKFKFTIENPT